MTNEEKAKEICDCDNCKACIKFAEEGNYALNSTCNIYEKVTQAMQWKDEQHKQEKQQLIEKACEEYCNGCGHAYMACRKYNYDNLHCRHYVNFKKAMEEEL